MIDTEALYTEVRDTPSDISEHVPTLRRLASECGHVTEFGVRSGNSTRAIMAGRPGRLVSYDITENEYVQGLFKQFQAEGYPYDYIIADVLEVDIDQTDMLFIDTWHAYDQLILELSANAAKVTRYIVMHDTVTYGLDGEKCYHKEPKNGLLAAIGEFLVNNRDWHVIEHYQNNNGLTVLEKCMPFPVEDSQPAKVPTWRETRGL